jgi:hypothetical protein
MNSVRAAFCNPSQYFATPDAARDWQSKHPGMEEPPNVRKGDT